VDDTKGVAITYLIDPDTKTYEKHLKTISKKGGAAPRTVQDVRGPGRQGARRDLDRHAQPLARPDDRLGLRGGQGRVRREAVQP